MKVLVAILSAAAMSVGCSHTTSGTATAGGDPHPRTPPFSSVHLDRLLLPADAINTAMGATGMADSGLADASLYDDSAKVSDITCLAVGAAAEEKSYEHRRWSSALTQIVAQPDDAYTDTATQSVVDFDTAGAAEDFFSASRKDWSRCADRTFSLHDPVGRTPDSAWEVGNVTTVDGILVTNLSQKDSHGWACQRALTVANNVVVDVKTCSYTQPENAAKTIAHDIAAKVSTS